MASSLATITTSQKKLRINFASVVGGFKWTNLAFRSPGLHLRQVDEHVRMHRTPVVLDVGNGFPVAHVQPDWVPQKLRVQVRRPFTVRPSPAQKDAHGKGQSLNFLYIFAPLDKTGQAMNSPVFPVLSKYFFFLRTMSNAVRTANYGHVDDVF